MDEKLDLRRIPEKLRLRCPKCDARISVPFYSYATAVFKRWCPRRKRCNARWQIKAAPVEVEIQGEKAWIHVVEWTEIKEVM